MAERMDPEEWAEVMNEAFGLIIAPVNRYGGTVARLLGDALLAYFGAPVAEIRPSVKNVMEMKREFG